MLSNNILVPALIFAAVGFLVGILVMILFSDRTKIKEKGDADNPDLEKLILPEIPVLPEERFDSIVHIYREKNSGKLVTDVKGKVHLTHNTIPADQLQNLQEASRSWQAWLGLSTPVPTPAPTPPLTPVPEPAPVSPAPKPETLPPVTVASAVRPAPIEKPRARTMVGQIEEILQDMLPNTDYAGQNIHLGEELEHGVVVWVGAQKFIGVDSVTDEGIKSVIKAAVSRWEDTGALG